MDVAGVKALFVDPPKLLRRCYLQIAGQATKSSSRPNLPPPPANGQAVIATFTIALDDDKRVTGFTTGFSGCLGRTKDRPFVKITKLPGPANAQPGNDEINAYYIPMVQVSDIADQTSHYTLPTVGGPDIMFTSKLSGCRFAVGSDAQGAVLVSHVQPDLTIAQGQRQTNLANAVTNSFLAAPQTFGLNATYTQMASVIGVRTGQNWRFYQQASQAGPQYSYVISHITTI
jgi:hypothetical protein